MKAIDTSLSFSQLKKIEHDKQVENRTYNAPEYELGRGATIDLLILFISACISCLETKSWSNFHHGKLSKKRVLFGTVAWPHSEEDR